MLTFPAIILHLLVQIMFLNQYNFCRIDMHVSAPISLLLNTDSPTPIQMKDECVLLKFALFILKFYRELLLWNHFMIFCLVFDTMRISHWLCHKNWEEFILLHILKNGEEITFTFYILLQQFYLIIIIDFRLFFVEGFSVLLS